MDEERQGHHGIHQLNIFSSQNYSPATIKDSHNTNNYFTKPFSNLLCYCRSFLLFKCYEIMRLSFSASNWRNIKKEKKQFMCNEKKRPFTCNFPLSLSLTLSFSFIDIHLSSNSFHSTIFMLYADEIIVRNEILLCNFSLISLLPFIRFCVESINPCIVVDHNGRLQADIWKGTVRFRL